MALVRLERQDRIAVIVIDNPPVNALSPGVAEGVIEAIREADADDGVEAMVLIGAGRSFIAGADIRHFGKGIVRPPIGERASDLLDQTAKPIVAAIHGYALGGGFEYALACHYRIALASARVGLPEVLIGAIPGGGGTQRLPRLIGPRAALDVIVSGRHVPAIEAKALGMLDDVLDVSQDLRAAAVAFARRIAGIRPLPRVRDMTARLDEARADPDLFDAKRRSIEKQARNQKVPYHCIAAVEASCSLSFEEGLRLERRLFEEIEPSTEARALRYAFFAEREAAKLPDVPAGTPTIDAASIAVIGAGTMGGGIAMSAADAGLDVKLHDATATALEQGMERIRRNYAISVERGRLSAEEAKRRLERIQPTRNLAALGDCDVAIEAVFEDLDVKRQVFARLDDVMKPDALLLSNTSAFDIDRIAKATRRPESVAGAHFFSPANVMKLLEVVRGQHTSPRTLLATTRLGRQLKKTCVVVRNCEGFLTSRSRTPFTTEAMILLEEGALPDQVDRVMEEFGYPMGPFAVSDLVGLDIAHAWRVVRAARDPGFRKLPIADRLVEMGRLGQKTGAGWYRYEAGQRKPRVDPEVTAIIGGIAADIGTGGRAIPDEEILHRLLFSAVNESCRILEEGLVYRASDIDVAWLHGFGFPRYRGGLMFWADGIGAARVHRQVDAWHRQLGARWAPARLLREAAESGQSLREIKPAIHSGAASAPAIAGQY